MAFSIRLTTTPGSDIYLPTRAYDEPTGKTRGPANLVLKEELTANLQSMDGHSRSWQAVSMEDIHHTLCLLGYGPQIRYLTGGHLAGVPRPPLPPGVNT